MLFDLYSKRRKRERGEFPDVYQYENIPVSFRVQFIHMTREAFTHKNGWITDEAIKLITQINNILRREYGVFKLAGKYDEGLNEIFNFVLQTEEYEKTLDVIEIVFRVIDKSIRNNRYYFNENLDIDLLIEELNQRFKETGLGYQYESGELIRVDSQFIHSEAVKPVIKLLNESRYQSVNEEFLSAHEHYRHGKYEESTTDCLKSLESLLKTICTNKNWTYDKKDNASKLIEIVLKNELIPSFMDSQLNTLRALLESGVPTVRNKLAGHGQGPISRSMPNYFATYVLHLTATTMLLLATAADQARE